MSLPAPQSRARPLQEVVHGGAPARLQPKPCGGKVSARLPFWFKNELSTRFTSGHFEFCTQVSELQRENESCTKLHKCIALTSEVDIFRSFCLRHYRDSFPKALQCGQSNETKTSYLRSILPQIIAKNHPISAVKMTTKNSNFGRPPKVMHNFPRWGKLTA